MGLRLVTGPQQEPITLAEAKDHLGVSGTESDFRIQNLIIATREWAENFTHRKLITQTWDWTIDQFPDSSYTPLECPLGTLQSVSSFNYRDSSDILTNIDGSPQQYDVDTISDPGRIAAPFGLTWPVVRQGVSVATIRIVVGYGLAAAVPRQIKTPMLLYIEALFDRDDKTMKLYIEAAESLLLPHRIYAIA